MYSNTRFHLLLEALPRSFVNRLSQELQANRYDKSFSPYNHLLALIYGQLSDARSLRELEAGFNAHASHHYHLGMGPLKRSTLSDANQRRNPQLFKALVEHLMALASRKQRKELRELLYLLDSSPIHLKGQGFEWAAGTASCRHQGFKLHLMIDGNRLSPAFLELTPPNVNDITPAWNIEPEAGATYVYDKGYTDYAWWYRLHQAGARFVTRFKVNARLTVESARPIPPEEADTIVSDEIVSMHHRSNRGRYTNPYYGTALRRITVSVPDKKKPLVIATNDLTSPAGEVAELYRRRWGIELFFKWLKQNLKLKRFLGRSPNAVLLQLYASIITYLLVWLYQQRQPLSQQTSQFRYLGLIELKNTLFTRLETHWHQHYRQRRRELDSFIQERQHVLTL